PALAVACEENFNCFSETGLARSVATHDESQAWARSHAQRLRRPDTPKSLDRERRKEGTGALGKRQCCHGLRRRLGRNPRKPPARGGRRPPPGRGRRRVSG